MPFGLKSAPVTFQNMINTIFLDMLGKDVYSYLDLIICNKNGGNHLANLKAVLLKLKETGLKAKLTKCEFLKTKITVHGHEIHTMDEKISAIKSFPQPLIC